MPDCAMVKKTKLVFLLLCLVSVVVVINVVFVFAGVEGRGLSRNS